MTVTPGYDNDFGDAGETSLDRLDLGRFEIPLDPRITQWSTTNLDPPYRVSAGGPGSSEYDHVTIDVVQQARSTADVSCLVDAAILSRDDSIWTRVDAGAMYWRMW